MAETSDRSRTTWVKLLKPYTILRGNRCFAKDATPVNNISSANPRGRRRSKVKTPPARIRVKKKSLGLCNFVEYITLATESLTPKPFVHLFPSQNEYFISSMPAYHILNFPMGVHHADCSGNPDAENRSASRAATHNRC